MKKAKLAEIADAMELQSDEFSAYLNAETGEIEHINGELLAIVQEGEDIGDSLDKYDAGEQDLELAREIAGSEQWLPLPSSFDINEYRIMQQFCWSRTDPDIRDRLLSAINGKGAFKKFKDTIHKIEIAEEWYAFRKKEFGEIAREWCKENGVECG